MSTRPSLLDTDDAAQLRARGIGLDEAQRQLDQLHHPPPALELVRSCTIGDGIERIEEHDLPRFVTRHDRAAADGRVASFVPASGAASRMFRDLLAYRQDGRALTPGEIAADRAAGRGAAEALAEFIAGLDRFAFHDALAREVTRRGADLDALRRSGPYRPILEALLDADGLGFETRPKGLVPFHGYPDGPRTAFEEHLAEAAAIVRDRDGRVAFDTTVADGFEPAFRERVERMREIVPDVRFEMRFSIQDPSTDTLAIDDRGQPAREPDGTLLLRPAGHGALLANLATASRAIVLVRNIDNVVAAPYREPTLVWSRVLVGRLLEVRDRIETLAGLIEGGPSPEELDAAVTFVRDTLGAGEPQSREASARRAWTRSMLDRPLRVAGMVPNSGETGGGPFWVRGKDGIVTRQIVETAQIRLDDPRQHAIHGSATHFNPVFLACLLDDLSGRRFDLGRFQDPDAAIVTRRSHAGHPLIALERPGLWNGGMARWNSVFVEVPLAVFNPVKTVNDLLKPEHQVPR